MSIQLYVQNPPTARCMLIKKWLDQAGVEFDTYPVAPGLQYREFDDKFPEFTDPPVLVIDGTAMGEPMYKQIRKTEPKPPFIRIPDPPPMPDAEDCARTQHRMNFWGAVMIWTTLLVATVWVWMT